MSELNDMTCAEFADVAAELALGVLTGRERAEALAHLDHCEACREHVRRLTMTGEQLLGLLPSREPPAGFETRVMERLGLTATPGRAPAAPGRIGPIGRFSGLIRRLRRPTSQFSRPVGRPRRLLAAVAVAVGVIAAGFGGWGLHAATAPTASSPLSSAALLSASHRTVGEVFYYNSNPQWIYMSVNLAVQTGTVTCQLVSTDGHVTTLGSFRLANGYGSWGSPATVSDGTLAGARLVAANGTVLATATLPAESALSCPDGRRT
jgi:hypothetical protein